jgi:hypothetical protein
MAATPALAQQWPIGPPKHEKGQLSAGSGRIGVSEHLGGFEICPILHLKAYLQRTDVIPGGESKRTVDIGSRADCRKTLENYGEIGVPHLPLTD